MIVRVYSVLEAFSIVRLPAASSEDGNTYGNSASHSVSVANTIVIAPKVKAVPSFWRRFARQELTSVSAATTPQAITAHSSGASRPAAIMIVHTTVPAATRITGSARRLASRWASSLTSPSDLR